MNWIADLEASRLGMDCGTGSACDLSGARERNCGTEVRPEHGNIMWAVQVSNTEWGSEVCACRSVSVGPTLGKGAVRTRPEPYGYFD